MTWPPHPASGSRGPVLWPLSARLHHCAHSAARTRAVPENKLARGGKPRASRDRVPDHCASVLHPARRWGGGRDVPAAPSPPIAERPSGGGRAASRKPQRSPAPKPNVAHPRRGRPRNRPRGAQREQGTQRSHYKLGSAYLKYVRVVELMNPINLIKL